MGKKSFNRKKAVRFVLVPGPEKDGRPTVLFKPVQTRKSQLSKRQRKEVISKLGDYEQITINGKPVDQHDIPAFVLDQIKGRSNLVYNQIHQEEEEQEIGDMYQIQDAKQDEDQGYSDYEDNAQQEQQHQIQEAEDQDWEDQEQLEEEADYQQEIVQKVEQRYIAKEEDFPQLPALQKVQIEGREYQLTKSQIEMLDTVIPQNYEQMDFGGLHFKRYNEDGLLLSEKQKYGRYLLGDNQKVVVVDTYEYVPTHAVNTVDNDLKPSQITKDLNIKAVQDALNYEGEQQVYDELQDDFFAKMIKGQLQTTRQKKSVRKEQAKSVRVKQQRSVTVPVQIQEQLDEKLQTAIFNYEHNIEQNKQKNTPVEQDSDEEQQADSNTNLSMNFTDLQKREEYMGKDGELDWRMLTRKEKKEYMKTKVIRQYYDELREREIEDKMKGISNVKPEQLHLKQLVKHITYEEDHVLRKALAEDLEKEVHLSDEDEGRYESLSEDEDDIVSFHQKTSIIASNLSVIEEPRKKKTVAKEKEAQQNDNETTKIKVIPEQRDRNETKEQRQERKKKLKELKKQRREQRGQFVDKFNKHKKQTIKRQNPNNPLSKVSLVKIY